MTRTVLRTVLPTAFLLAAGGMAMLTAQVPAQPPPGKGAQPPPTTQPGAAPIAYRAKQVLGSKIVIQNNVSIGTVDDIVLSDDGQVEYLIVAGDGGKLFTVPWEAAKVDYEKRTAVLAITEVQFKAIPTYTVQTYPQFFTPTYRTEVYKYYGLTPRDWRRIERGLPPKK